ncbi:MAG: SDR family NAD(P)-dependent oxidoreductase [Gemmatimonadetes bacterium]|nr:SDR family NAD(P)-dependent oxidoreductase [Gemmatimonadota bacterium]
MNRIRDKLILITGASSGIGEACARRFAAEGAHLVLWARRLDRLHKLADELENAHGGHVHVAGVDVRDRDEVNRAVAAILEAGDVPHVLLNNAGLASGFDALQDGDAGDWDVMIDTNIKGLLWVTRAVLPHMIAAGRGHIVNLGSTAGHLTYPKGNVYAATKYAVRALTDGINLDVVGTPIRVSSVDPGYVETEFSLVRFHGDAERAERVYDGFEPLAGADVADAIAYVINVPEHVNIFDVVMMPTAQRNVYIMHRKD